MFYLEVFSTTYQLINITDTSRCAEDTAHETNLWTGALEVGPTGVKRLGREVEIPAVRAAKHFISQQARGANNLEGATCRRVLSSGIPAWISGGVLRGGGVRAGVGGGGGSSFAGLHVGGEVPLLQTIYDELARITDPEGEAEKGLDSPAISKVLRLMDKLEPRDLGLSEGDFQGLAHSLCIPVFADGDAFFEMTVFVLPEGGEIPLHDHPNMAVLSKILFGSLEVESYDNVDAAGVEGQEEQEEEKEEEDYDDQRISRKKKATAPAAAVAAAAATAVITEAGAVADNSDAERVPRRTKDDAQRRRRDGAVVVRQQRQRAAAVTAESRSFLLTPSEGNVHAFKAPAACAVFDVLIPPYDNARGRKCSYFRAETPSSAFRPAGVETARNAGGAENAGSNDDDGDVENPGADQNEVVTSKRKNRVMLREILEPAGLPRWSRYHGPSVIPR
ncbi:unnamed protein product [Pylaiella littoralis]